MGVGETFVALAGIIMVTVLGAMRIHASGKSRGRKLVSAQTDEMARTLAATQSEVAMLKERVGVLEALATDADRRLAREIDQLEPRGR
jgi:precorrin-6B methylase 1